MSRRDPINPTDPEAIALAKTLLNETRFGALAVTHPDTGRPYVARVALLWDRDALITLVSTLSTHTQALIANDECAVLVGEAGEKGDPLTHPRMTITATAMQADKVACKDDWLGAIPKAKLYYDFTDFMMFRLLPDQIDLNGGFGKAYRLAPCDLS